LGGWTAFALTALTLTSARAEVSATAQACSAAYDKAQVLRRARQLRAAREQLLVCSQSKCPAAVTADCGPWLREVESAMPSIVVVARDAAGNDVVAAKVWIDGVLLASRLAGAALDVDPGSHTLTVKPEDGQRVEQSLLVNMGEKNRVIQVSIRPDASQALREAPLATPPPGRAPEAPSAEAPRKGSLVPGIVVGSVGVVSLGVSLGLYLSAKSALDGLKSSCAPHCSTSQVEPIRTKGLISDVTWGVGAAALGVGVLMMILMRPSADKATTPGRAPWVAPVVALLPGGGFAGFTSRL
jgi:hypothetical protein